MSSSINSLEGWPIREYITFAEYAIGKSTRLELRAENAYYSAIARAQTRIHWNLSDLADPGKSAVSQAMKVLLPTVVQSSTVVAANLEGVRVLGSKGLLAQAGSLIRVSVELALRLDYLALSGRLKDYIDGQRVSIQGENVDSLSLKDLLKRRTSLYESSDSEDEALSNFKNYEWGHVYNTYVHQHREVVTFQRSLISDFMRILIEENDVLRVHMEDVLPLRLAELMCEINHYFVTHIGDTFIWLVRHYTKHHSGKPFEERAWENIIPHVAAVFAVDRLMNEYYRPRFDEDFWNARYKKDRTYSSLDRALEHVLTETHLMFGPMGVEETEADFASRLKKAVFDSFLKLLQPE